MFHQKTVSAVPFPLEFESGFTLGIANDGNSARTNFFVHPFLNPAKRCLVKFKVSVENPISGDHEKTFTFALMVTKEDPNADLFGNTS